MNTDLIARTEVFLKETFAASTYLEANSAQRDYRLEHSYRVANIAKTIAEAEGFDVSYAVIAGLLHDIAYCEEMATREDWKNHGRRSATIARPFLEELGIPSQAVNEICYGIAIHVDDEADFEWERTPFAETVGDADNIDRFDVYRIYETLEYNKFSEMSLENKKETVASTIEKLTRFRDMELGTQAAKNLWQQRLDYYIDYYERLRAQLDHSSSVPILFYDTDDLRDQEIYLRLNRTCQADPRRKWLPAYYFDICLLGGEKIGYCDLRIGHNEKTYIGGNIGYGIDEAYRGNHYAAKACRLLFKLAKKHRMEYLIITCDPDNLPSVGTCKLAGGVFLEVADIPEDNEMYAEGKRTVNVYRFDM
jgi:uncharacterized protein